MPIYEYVCPRCPGPITTTRIKKVEEREKNVPDCPECHHIMVLRIGAPVGFPGADSWRR